jgi:hypothetical protein
VFAGREGVVMAKRKRVNRLFWGGFVDGKIDVSCMEDNYGVRIGFSPGIFTRRRSAQKRYEDVRPVRIVPVKPKRRSRR